MIPIKSHHPLEGIPIRHNVTTQLRPIPDLKNLEPFKLNSPNKPFNTEPQEALDSNYIKSLREFALDFIQEMHKEEIDSDNPVFSPLYCT